MLRRIVRVLTPRPILVRTANRPSALCALHESDAPARVTAVPSSPFSGIVGEVTP